MTKLSLTTLALAGALTFGGGTLACAQDSGALLDALVRKKVLTSQEAEDVRADLIRENAASNAGKLQLSNSVTSLKISGDMRLRYQHDSRDPQIPQVLTPGSYLLSANDTALINSTYYSNTTGTRFTSTPWAVDSKGYVVTSRPVYDSTGKLLYPAGSRLLSNNGQPIRGTVNPALSRKGITQTGLQRDRERIRLRLNGDIQLAGGFFGGVQLQTTQNSDSANQTMGDQATGASGFGNYNIYISRAYFGWANDYLTLVGGKQPNPFYTTDLVWDADINPDGFVEKVDLLKLFSSSNREGIRSENPLDLSLVAGQFIFNDNNEDLFGANYRTDVWLFNTQIIGSYKVTPDVKVTLAPGYMTYTSGNTQNLNNETKFMTLNSAGASVLNQYQYSVNSKWQPLLPMAATRDLSIITAPGDVSFKLYGQKVKVLWDFAYNTQGKARVENLYGLQNIHIPDTRDANGKVTRYKNTTGPITNNTKVYANRVSGHSSQDDRAWLAGVQIGENKKAGDWSLLANFRQTGIGAVDPNLNDSDFALGQLNMQGVKSGVAYNITDFCVGAVTYYSAWNLRKDLVGGQATEGQQIANMNTVGILQVDLNLKF